MSSEAPPGASPLLARADVVDPEWLRHVPIFASLSIDERAILARSLQRRQYARGEYLFHQGDPGNHLFLIRQGAIRIFTLSPDGQENTITTMSQGDALGEMALLDGLPRSASAQALSTVMTYALHRDAFHDHLRAIPDMAISILTWLSRSLRVTTTYAEHRSTLDTNERLATILLDLAGRHGLPADDGTLIDVPLTQRDLANMAGVSREWINKVMGHYRRAGLIRVAGRRIVVTDRDGLQAAARGETFPRIASSEEE